MDRSAYIKTIETSQKDKFRSILDLDGTLALAKRRKRKFPMGIILVSLSKTTFATRTKS